jgi:hypothetical protein
MAGQSTIRLRLAALCSGSSAKWAGRKAFQPVVELHTVNLTVVVQ